MRLFFALEPDSQTALQIADWRDRQFALAGRPVPVANLHITLAFLGDIAPAKLERVCLAVDEQLQRDTPRGGTLNLDQIGYWAKQGILWLGPSSCPDSLAKLSSSLQQLGTRFGCKRSRGKYQPHITLFRGCETSPPQPASFPGSVLDYRNFVLLESRQGKRGVSYHPLGQWQLD